MKFIRTTLPYVVASLITSLGLVFSLPAAAQYMWLDASGRKVFSDQPPPITVPAKNIKTQPRGAAPATTVNPEETTAASPAASENAASTTATTAAANKKAETKPAAPKDKDLEAAKKKLDDEVAAKMKAEQEKIDIAKAENCKRAKSSKATIDSGVRLAHTNDKGERGFMDDATRMVEAKRLEGIIATNCK